MDTWTIILLSVLPLGVLTGLYWGVALWRFVQTRRELLTARQALSLPEPAGGAWPGVCIVIPAHNEAHVVEGLVRSLRGLDYPRLMVVLSLDRCTDGTADVLARAIGGDARFIVHTVGAWREGWAGKVNAVWDAVSARPEAHDADMLLFADADTTFDPGCVRACVKLLRHRGAGLLSLLSTLSSQTWYEKLVQPATSLELVRMYPPLRVNRDAQTKALANGQFMLFTREAYFACGAHPGVRATLLEDLAIAKRVKQAGHVAHVTFADGMLRCRMYETWPAFVTGWRRLFIELARRNPRQLIRNALASLGASGGLALAGWLCVVLGLVGALGGHAPALGVVTACVGVVGLAFYYGLLLAGFRYGGAPVIGAVLYPFTCLVANWLMVRAALDLWARRPIRWAGREYVLEPLRRGEYDEDAEPVRVQAVPPVGTMLAGYPCAAGASAS